MLKKFFSIIYYRFPITFWDNKTYYRLTHIIIILLMITHYLIHLFLPEKGYYNYLETIDYFFILPDPFFNESFRLVQPHISLIFISFIIIFLIFGVIFSMIHSKSLSKDLVLFTTEFLSYSLIINLTIIYNYETLQPYSVTDYYYRSQFSLYFYTLMLIGVLFYFVCSNQNKNYLQKEHLKHLSRRIEVILVELQKTIQREVPGRSLTIREIASSTSTSQKEIKWVFNRYSDNFESNWQPDNELLFVSNTITDQINHLIDKIRTLDEEKEVKVVLYGLLPQLRESALPLSSIKHRLSINNEFEIFKLVNGEINDQNEYLIRLDLDFVTIKSPSYYCQLCKKHYQTTPYWQCKSCQKYICQEDYIQLKETGQEHPSCLECGGMLMDLPVTCKGCNTYFLTTNQLDEKNICPFCGNLIKTTRGEYSKDHNDDIRLKKPQIQKEMLDKSEKSNIIE